MSKRMNRYDNYRMKHIQLPKVFFTNEKYSKLSNDAKIAWAIFDDRNHLSEANDWYDENGDIYFIFSQKEVCSLLNCGTEKWQKIKKQLVKAELLEFERIGLNKTNRMYILQPEVTDDDIYKIKETEKVPSNPWGTTEVRKSNFRKFENRISRDSEIEFQEVRKSNSNNTDLSNTDLNNLEEEEEQQPLIDSKIKTLFVNQGFDDQEINKIFIHAEKKHYDLTKVTKSILDQSIKQTNKDLRTGVANDFYTWLAGKIDRLIKSDKHKQKGEPEKKKQTKGKPSVKKDKVPEYIQGDYEGKQMSLQEQIEAKEKSAELLKKHKGQEWYEEQQVIIQNMKEQQQDNYISRAAW